MERKNKDEMMDMKDSDPRKLSSSFIRVMFASTGLRLDSVIVIRFTSADDSWYPWMRVNLFESL